MRTQLISSLLFLTACCGLQAGTVSITIDPSNGSIQGEAGSQVGWGFTLANTSTDWISVVASNLIDQTDPGLGEYSDFIGPQGGPRASVVAPLASWNEAYDFSQDLGLGSFAISAPAAAGAVDSGIIDVQLAFYSENPNLCHTCSVGFETVDVPFSVTVAGTPEPSSEFLIVAVLGLGLGSITRTHILKKS